MSVDKLKESCIVVGAGIAGLCSAHVLQDSGMPVVILDQGRAVGGRLATRVIKQGVFDYGAQFFTVRDQRFGRLVDQWQAEGVVQEWCRGFFVDGTYQHDGYPRYIGVCGMTTLTEHLMRSLDVRFGERVVAVRNQKGIWEVRTEGGVVLTADALILTPPVPQSMALIESGNVAVPGAVRHILQRFTYDPCIAVMALLEGPSALPIPGGLKLSSEPLAWIADNRHKGISPRAWGVTIHAGPTFSRTHWETDDDSVARLVLEAADKWIRSKVCGVEIHRWRYSKPTWVCPDSCLFVPGPPPLVFAGDAFGGPRVEGATLSGFSAASRLLARLTKQIK